VVRIESVMRAVRDALRTTALRINALRALLLHLLMPGLSSTPWTHCTALKMHLVRPTYTLRINCT